MKKTPVIILFLLFLLLAEARAATVEELMHDSLAKGYLAGKEGNRKAAKTNFAKGFRYAKKAASWSGMIDAGMGFLVLGRYEDACEFFGKALKVIKKKKDWRGEIALAYVYLSMPKGFIDRNKAAFHFENAGQYAAEQEDWRGLMESSKGFSGLGSGDKAKAFLGSAHEIKKETKNLAEEEKKKHHLDYSRYYAHPYYYQYYVDYTYTTYLPTNWLSHWCDYHLGRYAYRDGLYTYVGL